MGGHGAWVVAVNNPERAVCVAPAASWIRKEEYAAANAFFDLDIQNSFVDPGILFCFRFFNFSQFIRFKINSGERDE